MKKFLGFLLAVCMVAMLVVTPMAVAAEGTDVEIDMGEGVVFTPGDINNDTAVNLKDLVAIAQKQAGWELEGIVTAALDTNADGAFTLADVTHLAQYLAGWDVDLSYDAYVG